jgi:hypothetical protein
MVYTCLFNHINQYGAVAQSCRKMNDSRHRCRIVNGFCGISKPLQVSHSSLNGYFCAKHRERVKDMLNDPKPIVLIIEAYEWDFSNQYIETMKNATNNKNLRYIAFKPCDEHSFNSIFNTKVAFTGTESFRTDLVHFIYILCHGSDDKTIGLGDDESDNQFTVDISRVLNLIKLTFGNVIWVHVAACHAMATKVPNLPYHVSGYSRDVTFHGSTTFDTSILVHAFNYETSAPTKEQIKQRLMNHDLLPADSEDVGFKFYPGVN